MRKVFIVSIDGATFDVLRPMVNQGCMPVLGRLIADGVAGELESTVPAITPPAWTSFMTGKNPGRHGVFNFRLYDPSDDSETLANSRRIRSKTIWQLLSERGKRVCVVNLPLTYPPYPVNGCLVAGFDTPSRACAFTYPDKLREEVLRLIPDYSFTASLLAGLSMTSERDRKDVIRIVNRGIEQTTRLALYLLRTREWDVFMVHYQDVDFLEHALWNDVARASNNPAAGGLAAEVRGCFRKLDADLETLLAEADRQGATKFALSDHGHGEHRGAIYPNAWLKHWGYLAQLPIEKRQPVEKRQPALRRVKDWVRDSHSRFLRAGYARLRSLKNQATLWYRAKTGRTTGRSAKFAWGREENPGSRLAEKLEIDVKRTSVFMVWGPFLYVNLAGRNPGGIVRPGAEYDRLLEELQARFKNARHPKTGEALFQTVARGQDIYQGKDGITLPDLVVLPAEGYSVSRRLGRGLVSTPPNEGNHRQMGIFIAHGPEIVASAPLSAPRIVDMAPTLLHLLELPVPKDMDGQVLQELFASSREVIYEEADTSLSGQSDAGPGYSAEDTEAVEERLRNLGYIS